MRDAVKNYRDISRACCIWISLQWAKDYLFQKKRVMFIKYRINIIAVHRIFAPGKGDYCSSSYFAPGEGGCMADYIATYSSSHAFLYAFLKQVMKMSWNGNLFPRYWTFVRGIHRAPVNSPHKGLCREALMSSLICVWINGWVNSREAGDLRRHRAHYDVTVMMSMTLIRLQSKQQDTNTCGLCICNITIIFV